MFTEDRLSKYRAGLFRLSALALFSFWSFPWNYTWLRFFGHAYIGSIGAAVNVKILPFWQNLMLLLGAAAIVIWELWYWGRQRGDYSIIVYLVKTFGGDFLAGKLDTPEWKLVLLFVSITAPTTYLLFGTSQFPSLSRVTAALFLVQLICEVGDAHFEHWTFFRHRYSFEVLTLGLLLGVSWSQLEIIPIQIDIVICCFYRASNLAIIILSRSSIALSKLGNQFLFSLLGWYTGCPILHIRSPEIAAAVLKSSSDKGRALECLIATPAWLPVLSLESVDGDLWRRMREGFDALLKRLPEVSDLQKIAQKNCKKLLQSKAKIDADAIAAIALATMLEYIFPGTGNSGSNAQRADILAAASEWRAEISVRKKGNPLVKQKAIDVLLQLLRNSPLWDVYKERWADPECFSILMQPFVISPVINVQDIMIAVQLETERLGNQEEITLEKALRAHHPFPILERFVDKDIVINGTVVVPAKTQCIMFTNDFTESTAWPLFGAGLRMCAGAHIAMPLLKTFITELVPSSQFDARSGHRHSGRHNDGQMSFSEAMYFFKTIVRALLRAPLRENKTL